MGCLLTLPAFQARCAVSSLAAARRRLPCLWAVRERYSASSLTLVRCICIDCPACAGAAAEPNLKPRTISAYVSPRVCCSIGVFLRGITSLPSRVRLQLTRSISPGADGFLLRAALVPQGGAAGFGVRRVVKGLHCVFAFSWIPHTHTHCHSDCRRSPQSGRRWMRQSVCRLSSSLPSAQPLRRCACPRLPRRRRL